ncbi:CU044_5270 family protein [Micromonospora sp. 4G55]|uniref:CU044_5270 family protein n=2 Tax=Micromonospora sp. 4G55 TaxID=2806102 RepID=UPI001A38A8DD|nr:CU044_5270 family protein [Micromonospora sp. 4G55]MBM0256112.1 CU044_5270 family protein [Micromonospora sp. 4G55]MBM0256289.1 CU044_5270 family protein [Micromonospora sp. 4G55]
MDEMRLLQQLGDETELPTAERLSAARTRLTTAMTAESSVPLTPTVPSTRPRPRRPAWRLVLSGVVSAGAAAALVSVLVLAPDRFGGDTPAARADASQVLRNAATAALRVPDVEPRPDQFVYSRSQEGPGTRESWMSVDGTRDGLVIETSATGRTETVVPGCRNGRAAAVKGGQVVPGVTARCTPAPAYRADLPTDADAMRTFLIEQRSGEPGDANAAGKDVLYYLTGSYLRPRTLAALYEAAATTPDLRAVEHVKDGAGRSGIGISWPSTRGSGEIVLVFHPETYTFLGVGGSAGSSAVLALAIVDRVGQTS